MELFILEYCLDLISFFVVHGPCVFLMRPSVASSFLEHSPLLFEALEHLFLVFFFLCFWCNKSKSSYESKQKKKNKEKYIYICLHNKERRRSTASAKAIWRKRSTRLKQRNKELIRSSSRLWRWKKGRKRTYRAIFSLQTFFFFQSKQYLILYGIS